MSSRSRRLIASALLGLAPLFAAGCATRADLEQVKNSQREVRKLLANYTVQLDEMRRRLDALQTDQGGGAKVSADDRRRMERLENRILELEARTSSAAAVTPPPAAEAPAGQPMAAIPVPAAAMQPPPGAAAAINAAPPVPAAPSADGFAADEAAANDPEYRSAVQLVRQGQCREAIPAFRGYIRKSAKSPAADNAQYLIGSCYYQQKDYNRAISELYEVLTKYPKGDKVPAATLLLADAFADSGDKIDAKLILQKLVNDHPQSPEAQRGKQKLQALSE